MKTLLLLKENAESAGPISSKGRLAVHEKDATPGCTCDRWGHPCADCLELKPQAENTRGKFSLIKKVR